jgi:hypothetical protein
MASVVIFIPPYLFMASCLNMYRENYVYISVGLKGSLNALVIFEQMLQNNEKELLY